MWNDYRMLNGIADGLYAVAAMLILYGVIMVVINLPVFPLRQVEVTGNIAHTTRDQVMAIVQGELRGNFFTQDLERARTSFEKLPWVRHANLRRQWPDRLYVEIEEHVALARWRDTALVNTYGEVYEAASNERLPVFVAPQETSAEVAYRYAQFQKLLAPLGRKAVQITLSERRAWQIKLDGDDVLELGREDVERRLQRFVVGYPNTIARLPLRAYRVDLRYPNGFAVRVPEGQAQLRHGT